MEAGQAFRWVRDVFYGGGSTEQYSLMDQEAAQSPLGARGVQAFIGPRMPDYTHLKFNVRGGFFFDLPPAPGSASRADFARAVLESIAFGVRANIERMQAITRVAIKSLSICGGVSKSYTFREALANVMNIPVFVPEQKEGSAMGAALCAGVGIGRAKTFAEAVTDMVHWECKLEPQVEKVEQYETLYQRWLPLLPQVHGQEGLGEIE